MKSQLEPQAITLEVLREKYAKGGEASIQDIRARVAKALASPESKKDYWEDAFADALHRGFIPAGRINSAAGTGISATLFNCFVQPIGRSCG